MPLICIGPICVPISAVLPVILWALRPLWEALPEPARARIQTAVRPFLDWLDRHVMSRMRGMLGGGKGAAAKTGAGAAGTKGLNGSAGGANGGSADAKLGPDFARALAAALDAGSGEVHAISSAEELAAAQALSAHRGCALVLDFTATWCGPCQRIKPHYAQLAKEHPSHLFAVVDVDDAPELQSACSVLVLPTFQVYRGSEKAAEASGGSEGTLAKLRAALGKKTE